MIWKMGLNPNFIETHKLQDIIKQTKTYKAVVLRVQKAFRTQNETGEKLIKLMMKKSNS